MGILADLFVAAKRKRCTVCGCYLYADSESDICECCIDDMNDTELEDEESLYPKVNYTEYNVDQARQILESLIDKRLTEKEKRNC